MTQSLGHILPFYSEVVPITGLILEQNKVKLEGIVNCVNGSHLWCIYIYVCVCVCVYVYEIPVDSNVNGESNINRS